MNKIKHYLISASMFLGLIAAPLFAPAVVSAQTSTGGIKDNVCKGTALTLSGTGDCAGTGTDTSEADKLIRRVVDILSVVVGFVAVIMIIIGGLKYVTSGGADGSVKGAKNTIMYAIIGLVIVLFAQIIVRTVVNKALN